MMQYVHCEERRVMDGILCACTETFALGSERPTKQRDNVGTKRDPAKCERMPREAGWGLSHQSSHFFPSPPICHTSNMSGKHVLQGAQNVVISGGTFNNADTVCEAL